MPNNFAKLFLYDPSAPLLFSGGQFLLWFSLFYAGFLLLHRSRRQPLVYLAGFSWFFYYKCSGHFLLALLATTAIDYVVSRRMAATGNETHRRIWLALSICSSGGTLLYFKYTNFLWGGLTSLFSVRFDPLDIALPAGISFYTFESVSYVVDVYRRRIPPARSFLEYATYLAYFPHLMAGPIMRAADLLPKLRAKRELDRDRVGSGAFMVLSGLVKKMLVADYLSRFSDQVFSGALGLSGFEILIGVYCYAIQIFCDFSGYSDMAIGLARICGIDLPINFRSPYGAHSITEFWHRWHVTLSSWLRDYLYIPLGGNRRGRLRTYVNLLVTMLFGGLWHGASVSFVLWGTTHGLLLGLEKAAAKPLARLHGTLLGRAFGTLVTFHLVALLWIPFRAPNLREAGALCGRVFSDIAASTISAVLHARAPLLLVLFLGVVASLVSQERIEQWAERFARRSVWVRTLALIAVVQAVIQVRTADVQPFIYFQF